MKNNDFAIKILSINAKNDIYVEINENCYRKIKDAIKDSDGDLIIKLEEKSQLS